MKIEASAKLTAFQVITVTVSSRLLINYAFTPTLSFPPANQDVWIVDILSGIYITLCYLPSLFFMKKFRNIFITDYCEMLLGKWMGKVLAFLIALYIFSWSTTFLFIFVDFIKTAALVTTPTYVIAGIMLAIATYSAYKGLSSIAKAAEILIFYTIEIIIIFTILGLNKMDFTVFLPILRDSDFLTINKSALFQEAGRFSDGVFLLVFSAFLDKKYSTSKCFFSIITIVTILYTLMTISTQAALGIELPKHMNFPYYEFTKQINVFKILQRIEFLNVIGWIFGFLFKLSPFLALSAIVMQGVFNTKSEKPFIVPLALTAYIVLLTSGLTSNPLYRKIIFQYIHYYISFFTYVVPFILLIVYFFRRKSIMKEIVSRRQSP